MLIDELKSIQSQNFTILPPSINTPDSPLSPITATSFGKPQPVNREYLSVKESPRMQYQNGAPRGCLQRSSVASMLSRGSGTGDRLSITFSILSAADSQLENASDDAASYDLGDALEMKAQPEFGELHDMLRQVSTSFMNSPPEKTPEILENSSLSGVQSSILGQCQTDDGVRSRSQILHTPSTVAHETTSLASSNMASQGIDAVSKDSTLDLESVSTAMSAPYTSSPVHMPSHICTPSIATSYANSGVENATDSHSPKPVQHRFQNRRILHSPHSPYRPSAKSTDSGIRSNEESDTVHTPEPLQLPTTTIAGEGDAKQRSPLPELANSMLAAFDSWL